LENDGHFGRHLGFMKNAPRDSQGLLVYYSTHIAEAILKIQLFMTSFKLTSRFLWKWRPFWTPSWIYEKSPRDCRDF